MNEEEIAALRAENDALKSRLQRAELALNELSGRSFIQQHRTLQEELKNAIQGIEDRDATIKALREEIQRLREGR